MNFHRRLPSTTIATSRYHGRHGFPSGLALAVSIASTAFVGMASATTTWTVTTIQDDAPPGGTCNTGHSCLTLRDAIHSAADGDTIVFDLSGYTLPAMITLADAEPLVIAGKSLTIHGPGHDRLSISGAGASRVFDLPDNTPTAGSPTITIDHLSITAGIVRGNAGTDASIAGMAGGGGSTAEGGCVYVGTGNTLHLDFDLVTDCLALGGAGGRGADGATGTVGADAPNDGSSAAGGTGGHGGHGGNGGAGGDAHGGAVAVHGLLFVDSGTFRNNYAVGGAGGDAGAGGTGGAGGKGGNSPCAVVGGPGGPCLPIGSGGAGGAGGSGGDGGRGGAQGSALGGAVFDRGSVAMLNATLVDNLAAAGISFFGPLPTGGDGGTRGAGGEGGTGGVGSTPGSSGQTGEPGLGGVGGRGGDGSGGGFYGFDTAGGSELKHVSIAFNNASGGFGGLGANGSEAGANGDGHGAGITNGAGGSLKVWNSIVADNMAEVPAGDGIESTGEVRNCRIGSVLTLVNDNLDDDPDDAAIANRCGFDTHGEPNFAPPVGGFDAYPWGGNDLPVLMPLSPSPAIDGARVYDPIGNVPSGGCAANVDEIGTPRPLPGILVPVACDLGAVESDIIFRNGFDD